MPDVADFLRAFSLVRGAYIGGFQIINVSSTHETIKRYHEYQFHITVDLQLVSSHESLQSDLVRIVGPKKIVNSRYGNPYECWIELNEPALQKLGQGQITLHLVGHAIRV